MEPSTYVKVSNGMEWNSRMMTTYSAEKCSRYDNSIRRYAHTDSPYAVHHFSKGGLTSDFQSESIIHRHTMTIVMQHEKVTLRITFKKRIVGNGLNASSPGRLMMPCYLDQSIGTSIKAWLILKDRYTLHHIGYSDIFCD